MKCNECPKVVAKPAAGVHGVYCSISCWSRADGRRNQ